MSEEISCDNQPDIFFEVKNNEPVLLSRYYIMPISSRNHFFDNINYQYYTINILCVLLSEYSLLIIAFPDTRLRGVCLA
jgi:hypothetical protein